MDITKDKLAFIEESGLLMETFGLTRMAGRVFGYLMVCDQDAVSFDDIRDTLSASKGSISATMKMLVNTHFIEAVSLPGDRKTYYRISRNRPGDLIRSRFRLFDLFGGLLDKAAQLKNRNDETGAWLQETAGFYRWIQQPIEEAIRQWESNPNIAAHATRENGTKTRDG
ncbi:MAG: hypothetical protein LAT75_14690 [Candidatus Cyclonatronum sp.]|uniref:GbsR/MarR family transcriptional regulator n=1 Tax=Cyclonatronum sp. TaxID=3024185 RepID=UPI0025C5372C|nr:hypothetical protein [Cyclonatronum sp.]MCC5934707.1 hypothetical protein [Balneolales bacterium]MCH8488108.1 hypothetical protein [Cyclonatronum sp.]